MALTKKWAGGANGTNIGKLFVVFDGEDNQLTGILRFADNDHGIAVYSLVGSFKGDKLSFEGEPQSDSNKIDFGKLKGVATLDSKGTLRGDWETSIGTGGTFVLHPQDSRSPDYISASESGREQLHTARHSFGAIEITKDQIVILAEEIQQDFKNSKVVVTTTINSEQSRYLEDFKSTKFNSRRARIIKIYASELENASVNRTISVEFGPYINVAMVQSSSEAWALGRVERLKRDILPYQRSYATNFQKFGFGVNQVFIFIVVALLPGIASLTGRVGAMLAVLGAVQFNNWFHARYIPFATIHLSARDPGLFSRIGPSVLSWIISASSGLAAALITAYLQG